MTTQPIIGTDVHTFLVELGCSEGERVSYTAGDLNRAGAAEIRLGVATRDIAAGAFGPIRLASAPSAVYVTDVAISIGEKVYGAAAGKVAVTGGGNESIGIAVTASGGTAGEHVEVVHASV